MQVMSRVVGPCTATSFGGTLDAALRSVTGGEDMPVVKHWTDDIEAVTHQPGADPVD